MCYFLTQFFAFEDMVAEAVMFLSTFAGWCVGWVIDWFESYLGVQFGSLCWELLLHIPMSGYEV